MADKYVPRLQKKYNEEIINNLVKELEIKNIMQVPRLEKNSSKYGNRRSC